MFKQGLYYRCILTFRSGTDLYVTAGQWYRYHGREGDLYVFESLTSPNKLFRANWPRDYFDPAPRATKRNLPEWW